MAESEKISTTRTVQGISLDEWDAANDALDVLEFVRCALVDTNAMGDERANSGLDFCLMNAIKELKGLLAKAYDLMSEDASA